MVDDRSKQPDTLLLQYWHILKKRRLIVGSFTGLLVLTVVIATAMSTRYYSSAAVVEISPRAPQIFEVQEVTEIGTTSAPAELRAYYGTQYRILQSRKLMASAIKLLQEEHGITDFDGLDKPEAYLRSHLSLNPQADTNLVHIVIEYPDPQKAALFANTIAEVYQEQNLSRARLAAEAALSELTGLKGQYEEYKRQEDEAVAHFKHANNLLGIDERYNSTLTSFGEVQTSWNKTNTARISAEAEYSELRRLQQAGSWDRLVTHLAHEDTPLDALQNSHIELELEKTRLATRYLPEHPAILQIEAELAGSEAQLRARAGEIIAAKKAALDLLIRQEEALNTRLVQLKDEVQQLDLKRVDLQIMETKAERAEELYKSLDLRMSEVDLSQFVRANNINLIDTAIPGDKPVRPNMVVNVLMALVLGLLGGAALSFLAEYLDNTVKSREDLERIIGVPMLGYVPLIDPAELEALPSTRDRSIFVNARPRSSVAECLRSVRTNIMFRTQQNAGHLPFRTFLVTSAAPREGKSFMSSNLSTIVAMTGSRVLLIDADLRRPNIHRLFDVPNDAGLSDVLTGNLSLEQVIRRTHVPDLDIIVAGPIPPNPAELLGSERMKNIKSMIRGYDVVIIDTPPVTIVADPLVLTPLADGLILVVESNRTSKNLVTQAVSRLEEMSTRILGAVVNKLDVQRTGYGYNYYYADYGYYSEEEYEEQTRKLG